MSVILISMLNFILIDERRFGLEDMIAGSKFSF